MELTDDHLEQQIKLTKRLLAIEEAKKHLFPFIRLTMPDPEDPEDSDRSRYQDTPQARLLCDMMEKAYARKIKRQAVSISPQMGKSQVISISAIAWMIGKNPRAHFIIGTYNEQKAGDLGIEVRDIINSPAYKQIFPEVVLEVENTMRLKTSKGGRINFVGAGGSTTGMVCDFFVIDDPIKNDEEAQSQAFRDKQWAWFNSVVTSRCRANTVVVIVHCLTGETRVTMADNTRKQLKYIRPGDEVLAYADGKWVSKKVLNWKEQGEDDIFTVKTGNSTIRGNAKHPVLVRDEEGERWVPIGELQVGDRVVTSAVEPVPHDQVFTPEQAWLLGFMFGDGWLTFRTGMQRNNGCKPYPRKGIVTCCALSKYPALNDKILDHFDAVFGARPKATRYGYIRTEIQKIGKWFEANGLIGRAKTKRIPPIIFGQPVEIREKFLLGFSQADGHIDKTNQTTVACANEDMIADLRDLARGTGVVPSNIHRQRFVTQPPNSPAPVEGQTFSFKFGVQRETKAFRAIPIRSIERSGREKVYDIQVEGAENFIADGVVVHNTRWSQDDLIGRLCDPSHPERNKKYKGIANRWNYINIPAVITDPALAKALGLKLEMPTDPDVIAAFGNKPMCSLWEDQHPLTLLAEAKMLDERTFSALRMGNPTPDDGVFFTESMIVEYDPHELPDDLRIYGASDHAVSSKQKADSSVIGCVGLCKEGDLWVLPDVFWDKVETNETVEEIIRQMKTHRPGLWWMEDELISKSFGPFLKKRMQEESCYFTIDPVRPSKDKQTRARAIQGRMQMRKVRFPRFASWWPEAKAQVKAFPYGAHDDFVDWMAHIGAGLLKEHTPKMSKKETNVVQVGSIEWMLAQTKRRAAKDKVANDLRGW